MMYRLKIILLILSLSAFAVPSARAADPVAIAVLAPAALKAFQTATPLAIRMAKNTLTGLTKIGKDVFEIFYLPYGLGKMSIGYPFGGFRSGVYYTVKGCIAPGKLVVHTIMLPANMVGVETNF